MEFTQFVKNALEGNVSQEQISQLSEIVAYNTAINLIGIQKRGKNIRMQWVSELVVAAQGKLERQGYQHGIGNTGITPFSLSVGKIAYTGIALTCSGTDLNLFGGQFSSHVNADLDIDHLTAISDLLGHDYSALFEAYQSLEHELQQNKQQYLVSAY
jgi:hypothetical protein